MLSEIIQKGFQQLDLFTPLADLDRERTIMKLVDSVNADWGSGTMSTAAEGIKQSWAMKRGKLTPRYTTHRDELPVVRV